MDEAPAPGLKAARQVYRMLMLAYPREHRQEYGPWMVQLFCDQYRAALVDGRRFERMIWLWLRILADLVENVVREQWADLRRRLAGAPGESGPPEGGRKLERIMDLILTGLAMVILTILSVFFFGQWLGQFLTPTAQILLGIFYLVAYLAIGIRLKAAARKWRPRTWFIVTAMVFLLLLEPTYALDDLNHVLPITVSETIFQIVSLIILFFPATGLVIAACLLANGLRFARQARTAVAVKDEDWTRQRRRDAWTSAAFIALSGLLLTKLIFNLYWDAVWDKTTDSIGIFWLTVPVSAAIFCGALLAAWLPWRIKWIGPVFTLLICTLMVVSFNQGAQVDYRQLTAERASVISRAIEAYEAREGRYPQQLAQLVPGYLLFLPDPVIMIGQTWCYQGGADYYRLGYLDSNHWSSPLRFGRVLASKGHLPQPVDVCEQAIAAYHAKYPDWQAVEKEYGQPTPTVDLGK